MHHWNTDTERFDPEIFAVVAKEERRQEEYVQLVASENYASARVMQLQGSVLTNKYAEGYPDRRYYGGCEYADTVEALAVARAKQLFGAGYANVQPHSCAQANAAVYMALIKPRDTILGLSLDHGGHRTHGAKPNFSGKLYRSIAYGIDLSTGCVDYDGVLALAKKHRPRMLVAGFSAYARVMDWARFRAIADEVGALLFVDMAHVAGLVAAGLYPNPVPYADVVTTATHKTLRGPRGGIILAGDDTFAKKFDSMVFPGIQGGPMMHMIAAKAVALAEAMQADFLAYQKQVIRNAQTMAGVLLERGYDVVSGGTDTHLVLVNLSRHGLTGKLAASALEQGHILLTKCAVPNDRHSPLVTSGIRIGTSAVTTRGMGQREMYMLAHWICDVFEAPRHEQVVANVRRKVLTLLRRFPVYQRLQPEGVAQPTGQPMVS